MKYIFLAAAILIAPIHAKADTAFCQSYGDVAEWIMKNRQANAQMSRVMAIFTEPNESPYRRMVREAYGQIRWEGPLYQGRAVSDFRNKHELECFEALGND